MTLGRRQRNRGGNWRRTVEQTGGGEWIRIEVERKKLVVLLLSVSLQFYSPFLFFYFLNWQ